MAGCLKPAVNTAVKHEIAGLYEKMSASSERFYPFALTMYLEPFNDQSSAPYEICKT